MIDSLESELEEKYKNVAYIFAYMLTVYQGIKYDDSIILDLVNYDNRKQSEKSK